MSKKSEPSKSVTKRLAIQKAPRLKVVPEGDVKWTAKDVDALREKLNLTLLPQLVPESAYDARRWPIDQMTCTEVLLLGEMLLDYRRFIDHEPK